MAANKPASKPTKPKPGSKPLFKATRSKPVKPKAPKAKPKASPYKTKR